jgi:acylphosphatase
MAIFRTHVKIKGLVQGVGYRAWAFRAAKDLNLGGWIKNCDDGTVEAIFEGEKEIIEKMLHYVWKGPRYASVEEVEVISKMEIKEISEFRILK